MHLAWYFVHLYGTACVVSIVDNVQCSSHFWIWCYFKFVFLACFSIAIFRFSIECFRFIFCRLLALVRLVEMLFALTGTFFKCVFEQVLTGEFIEMIFWLGSPFILETILWLCSQNVCNGPVRLILWRFFQNAYNGPVRLKSVESCATIFDKWILPVCFRCR